MADAQLGKSAPRTQRKVMVRERPRPFHWATIDLSEAAAQTIGPVQSPGMLVRLRPVARGGLEHSCAPSGRSCLARLGAPGRAAAQLHALRQRLVAMGLLKNRQATELLWQKLLRDQPELRPSWRSTMTVRGLRLQAGPFPSAAFALGMSPPHEAPQSRWSAAEPSHRLTEAPSPTTHSRQPRQCSC